MMWATFDNDFNKRKLCVSNKHLDIKVITVPLGDIVSIKFELYVLELFGVSLNFFEDHIPKLSLDRFYIYLLYD